MLGKESTYKILRMMQFTEQEIAHVMEEGEHEIEIPKVKLYTEAQMRGLKEHWKHSQQQVKKEYKRKGALV